jgi:septal ring factor EnvC (AmiA/AmiB activator)
VRLIRGIWRSLVIIKSLSKFEDGTYTELVAPQPSKAVTLNTATLPATDKKALDDFCKKIAELSRVVQAADQYRSELANKLRYMKQAAVDAPKQTMNITTSINNLEKRLHAVNRLLNGDQTLARREF